MLTGLAWIVCFYQFLNPLQQSDVATQPTLQRDPGAIAALVQASAIAGWSAKLPATILATGTRTRTNEDGTQQIEDFTLKQRGISQFRLDIQDNGANSATIINGLTGGIVFPDGTQFRLKPQSAISSQSPTFPFLTDLVGTADGRIEVKDLGSATVESLSCHGVYLMRHTDATDQTATIRDLAAPLTVWISQDTGLPVRIDFIRLADDNPYMQIHFSRTFSDYRVVDGIAVPFSQAEYFEGQLMYRIDLKDVQFNSPVTDSDFALPKV